MAGPAHIVRHGRPRVSAPETQPPTSSGESSNLSPGRRRPTTLKTVRRTALGSTGRVSGANDLGPSGKEPPRNLRFYPATLR